MAPNDPSPPDPANDALAPVASRIASDHTGPEAIGPLELFVAFSRLALSGFGGVLPFAYRSLVERRRWLAPREFASLLAIAQVLPGPTICNLSVMIGQRYAGFAGACAAVGGMVLGPSCIVIALGVLWQHYGDLAVVKRGLGGMSAVAIGLILATAVKMGINLFTPEVPDATASSPEAKASSTPGVTTPRAGYWTWERVAQVLLCTLGFVGVGLLRWPLAAVVAGLAPVAIAIAWFMDR